MSKFLQDSKIDLSIVIVNYNTGKLLSSCLASIKRASSNLTSPKTEVILIENASSDNSLSEALKTKIPLTLVKNKENVGFAKAVNQGIRKSEGKCVFLLNPDTKVEKDALSALVEFAERKTGVGVVGAKLLSPKREVQESVFYLPTIWRAIKEYWLGGAKSQYAPKTSFPVEVEAVVGGAMLITRETIEKVGLLDERYFMYFEDLDYCRRTRKAGLSVYYLPEARIIHYHGASGTKLARAEDQWKRLIPGSKIYHGPVKHYLIWFISWTGQKWQRLIKH